MERAKDDPVIFEHLGDAYAKIGLHEDALAAWEKSFQLDPTDGVKNKIEKTKSNLGRLKGERSKASQ